MKLRWYLLFIALAVACYIQRDKFDWENLVEATRVKILNMVQKPEDKVTVVQEKLPPVPPENVYYTLDRIEYPVKPFGTRAFEVGTPVRKVGEGNNKFVVEAGVDRAIVDPVKLTREPREIARVQKLADQIDLATRQSQMPTKAQLDDLDNRIKGLSEEKLLAEKERQPSQANGFRPSAFRHPDPLFIQHSIERLAAQKAALEQALGRPQPVVQNVAAPSHP